MIAEAPMEAVGEATLSVSLWRNSVHTLASGVASVLLGFTTTIIVARVLGPAGKGSYDLVVATAMLLVMVLDLSLPAGLTYVVSRSQGASRSLATRIQWIALFQALAAFLAVLVVTRTPYSTLFLPAELVSGLLLPTLVALLMLIMLVATYWRAIAAGRQRFVRINIADLVGKALLLAGVAMVAVLSQFIPVQPVLQIVGVTLLGSTATAVLMWRTAFNAPQLQPARGDLRSVLAFALPCYAGNLAQFLSYRMDVFIVSFFWGTQAVGLYGLAVGTTQLIWLIPNSVAAVLLPVVAGSHGRSATTAARTAQLARVTLFACAGASIVLGLLAGLVIPIIYGDAFRPSAEPLLWLLPGTTAFGMATVCAAYIAGTGQPRLNLWVALGGLAVTAVLDLILIPTRGIVGAAVASTVSYSFTAVVTTWLVMRHAGLPLLSLVLPTGDDLQAGLALIRSVFGRLLMAI